MGAHFIPTASLINVSVFAYNEIVANVVPFTVVQMKILIGLNYFNALLFSFAVLRFTMMNDSVVDYFV